MPTLYDILGVERSTDPASLRRAYRKLARKYHPDVNQDPRSHDLMARINDAFETLIDPARRSEYDAMLAGGYVSAKAPKAKQPLQVKLLRRLKAHRTPVYTVGFAPDGQLVTSSFDNEIVWWDKKSWVAERTSKLEGSPLSTLRVLPNGAVSAAGCAESDVSIWSIGVGDGPMKNVNHEWASCLSISGDGKLLASGSIHRNFSVTEVRSGKRLYFKHGHDESVTALAWSPDSRLLATGSADNTVKLWKRDSGDHVHTFQAIRSPVTAIAFSPDHRFLAVAAVDLSIRVFSLTDGTLQKMMFGHTKPIETLAFHPNSWLFASGGREGAVKLWNADKGLGQLHIDASPLAINTLSFSPDGKLFAAGGLDKHVRLWEITAKENE